LPSYDVLGLSPNIVDQNPVCIALLKHIKPLSPIEQIHKVQKPFGWKASIAAADSISLLIMRTHLFALCLSMATIGELIRIGKELCRLLKKALT